MYKTILCVLSLYTLDPLELCSSDPLTGFTRTGFCETNEYDEGTHLICVNNEYTYKDTFSWKHLFQLNFIS